VLVYARDHAAGERQRQAWEWMSFLWRQGRGRLSFQVLQEFYVTVTRKLVPPLEAEEARRDVRALCAWQPLALGQPALEEAWSLQDRYSLSWWDALIVAAARLSGCRTLLTEDLQDGQELGGLRVVSPFLHPPP
jgi:predicted nucleic acid-binding protein